MRDKPFRTAAVLGAGVMGTQIAAQLANVGLTVHLLDLPGPAANKNQLVETAFQRGLKQTPPMLFTEKTARRIHLGNFEQDFHRIAAVDWVIEAVVEKLAVKQQLMERLEGTIADHTIVSTNTSGLSIQAIAAGRSDSFRRRFLGTHFFNPPRYLKLLELIPTADTDPAIVDRLQRFAWLNLGKGVVVAKDTPNFIANRLGLFATMLGLRALTEQGYTIEEIDRLTGPLIGRPKSATFRTADLVGLDTLLYVAEHLCPAIPEDESRARFQMPDLVHKLVASGSLGAKTGQGFYKKEQGQIRSLNLQTLAYEPAKPMNLGDVEAIAKLEPLEQRLQALYQDQSRAGQFFRQSTLELLAYAARRLPEIADSPADVDRALRWGFGWELGPFELWDALGFTAVLADLRSAQMALPSWVDAMQQSGASRFYLPDRVYVPDYGYRLLCLPTDVISLPPIRSQPSRLLWQNSEAALLDLEDGVALYEFRSKGNTLSMQVVNGLNEVLNRLETTDDLRGLVIGNDGENFCAGANLAEMARLAMQGQTEAIADLIEQFQQLMQRVHYFPKPIVAAVQGRTLGGGCELVMACPQVVAAAESYIGLVELGVGLIPGGSGLMRMATLAADRAASESPPHLSPFLIAAFETIATAKVSNSAYEAQALGFLSPTARIVNNPDRRLFVAKQEVLCLDRTGYIPPPERSIPVLGCPARAVMEHSAYIYQQGGFASEYDRYLADRVAYVLTGGDLSAPSLVSEDYLLQLERDAFLPLLSQPKTQERISHLLKTKKPLRN